jgi:hypothetical protein
MMEVVRDAAVIYGVALAVLALVALLSLQPRHHG